VAEALAPFRRIETIEPPGTIDGGDVLVVGREVYVGLSFRTNAEAIAQLRRMLAPFAYRVTPIYVRGCLHLKSAVTALADDVLLANKAWIDPEAFAAFKLVEVAPGEPSAANVLRLSDRIVAAQAFPRTADRVANEGFHVCLVDASELAKAEGAVTCCSLIVPLRPFEGVRVAPNPFEGREPHGRPAV